MKKLTGALALSLSLLLTSGCRSAGETRDSQDASTPAISGGTPSEGGVIDKAREATHNEADSGPPANKALAGSSSYAATLSPAEKQAQENCLDKWLQGKKLDRYGHPEGTMYAGGSPIFNEVTGESRERLDYVYERQPEAKQACATAAQGTPGQKK